MIERQPSLRLMKQTSRRKLANGRGNRQSNTPGCASNTDTLSSSRSRTRMRTDSNIACQRQDPKNNTVTKDRRNGFVKQNSLSMLGNNCSTRDRRAAFLKRQQSLSLLEIQPLECSDETQDEEALKKEGYRRREDGNSRRESNKYTATKQDRRKGLQKQKSLTTLGKKPSSEDRRARYLRTKQQSLTLLEDEPLEEETNVRSLISSSRRLGSTNTLCDDAEVGEDDTRTSSVGSYLHGVDGINRHGVYGNTNQHRNAVVDIYRSRRKRLKRYGTQ